VIGWFSIGDLPTPLSLVSLEDVRVYQVRVRAAG
jgi:hypothetical protein